MMGPQEDGSRDELEARRTKADAVGPAAWYWVTGYRVLYQLSLGQPTSSQQRAQEKTGFDSCSLLTAEPPAEAVLRWACITPVHNAFSTLSCRSCSHATVASLLQLLLPAPILPQANLDAAVARNGTHLSTCPG